MMVLKMPVRGGISYRGGVFISLNHTQGASWGVARKWSSEVKVIFREWKAIGIGTSHQK
jgi:hypothetical protein